MLVGVAAFILKTPSSGPSSANNIANAGSESVTATGALDQLSSADIAVQVAIMTKLYQAPSVANHADTMNAQLAVTPADDTVIAKPQVVATALKSYKDIQTYVTVEGDNIPNVAAKFGITSETVRWSNGLQGDNLSPGMSLVISPVNGIVYTVKDGDTIDTIASKYRANKDQIIADNDAEAGGLRVGQRILIRDGSEAPVVIPRVATAATYGAGFAWGGGNAVYQGGANGYDYGYCTWWAANRRAQIGRPVPSNLGNASTWLTLAQRAGFATGSVPQAGAVIWTRPYDWYGHVGFVESVNDDGSANISEMNVAGWGVVSRKTLSAAEAANYLYIY
ncbi:LysM peptidoglycan-binding domain-containing protein [Candidatus Saccharibacteria bacterium]|nr:MAG: LysM peptidoglycan-binding domain-containing protein [Candidatus Saccharibacteria bacterium]